MSINGNVEQYPAPFSYQVDAGTTILCLNAHANRLIAAGRQNFQLLAIESTDQGEVFSEIYDFRNLIRGGGIRTPLQPTDIGWSPFDDSCFASATTTGFLYIWDASQLKITGQFRIHQGTINRLQFDPSNPKYLLTASQDGYAKLIDYRLNTTNRVVCSFRHSSEDGFRDIHINPFKLNLFAAALNDQMTVPIWDLRHPEVPQISITTADRTQCLAWNPHEAHWLATGGRDRTIRIWNTDDPNGRQKPLFKVQSFGTVNKLGWRPTCRYQIACSTPTVDPRIHVWDVRRTYLPQASFCSHQNSIGDFLWRGTSDNLLSVGRDGRLVHSHVGTALKTDEFVSLFSLNATSKGSVYVAMPNVDNDYVQALCKEKKLSDDSISVKKPFSANVMSKFSSWNQMITAKSIIGIVKDPSVDNSVELFHQFARRWTLGTGEKSSAALAMVCDINGAVAEQFKRSDLKATWQVMKMIYADAESFPQQRTRSSRATQSSGRNRPISDTVSGHRHRHYHTRHPHPHGHGLAARTDRATKTDPQQSMIDDYQIHDEDLAGKRNKTQEQNHPTNRQMEMIDDADTYIVRDVLTDDIIFITPEDTINSGNNEFDIVYDNEFDIDGMEQIIQEIPPHVNGDSDEKTLSLARLPRQYPEIVLIENDIGPNEDYDDLDGEMQVSTQSILPDGSDKFFTIDESYCPSMQNHQLSFDPIIQKTIYHYIETNEIQMAVHLLLALYPKLGEAKIYELFSGAHHEWIGMYIDLLQKLRLFVKSAQVAKHAVEKQRIHINYDPSEYDGKMILIASSPVTKRLPNSNSMSNGISSGKASSNSNSKDYMCAICRIPCRGYYSFCGVCFHGGHLDHIRKWFHKHDECPAGCGHRCRDPHGSRSRSLVQRFLPKPCAVLQP